MSTRNGNGRADVDILTLAERFHSDDKCRAYLEALRWPEGVRCPRCQSDKVSRIWERSQYDCDSCRYQFSVTAGTIFHDSHLPLTKWFIAIYLMGESKKSMSANQIKRTLRISYKTAWYLCHRIRAAVKDANPTLLKGIVEVDETWVGGVKRGFGRAYTGNKALVVGATERKGGVRLMMAKKADRKTLHGFIKTHTDPATERIMTDEREGYKGIADHDTTHETVKHSAKEYVRGDVYTNTIEGAFSLFKRSVVGAYHHISHKHLPAYLDEFEFRYDNRKNPYWFRDTLLKLLSVENLPFKSLVEGHVVGN